MLTPNVRQEESNREKEMENYDDEEGDGEYEYFKKTRNSRICAKQWNENHPRKTRLTSSTRFCLRITLCQRMIFPFVVETKESTFLRLFVEIFQPKMLAKTSNNARVK